MSINDVAFAIIIITIIMVVLVISVLLVVLAAARQRSRQLMALSQAEINYQGELRKAEAEVQEATLEHVSTELHDNIGQLLTVLHIEQQTLQLQHPEMAAPLASMHRTLNDVIAQVRLLSHSLNTGFITDNGLPDMILAEVRRLQVVGSHQVACHISEGELCLSRDNSLLVFRMFQEVLSNILRHANATQLQVHLQAEAPFSLRIRDDGIVFNLDDAMQKSQGIGLKNLLKRAALAKVNFTVAQAAQKGNVYSITGQ